MMGTPEIYFTLTVPVNLDAKFSLEIHDLDLRVHKIYLFIYLFVFLRPYLRHVEVPRLGVQSELLPPAYATATTTLDLS